MIYKDITVKKPKECIVYARNNYVYYTVEKIYNKEKQYNTNKRVLIGVMIDNIYMHPNDNAREFFPEWFKDKIPEFSDCLHIGFTFIIDKVMKKLGITRMLDNYFEYNEANLIKDMIQYMIINDTTNLQHISSFMYNTIVYSNKIYDASDIKEIFNKLSFGIIESFMDIWVQENLKDSVNICFDTINMQCNGIKLNNLITDDNYSTINFALILDNTTSMPLFYKTYPKRMDKHNQLTYAIEKINNIGCQNVELILDKGCYSYNDIKQIVNDGNDVMILLNVNQTEIKDIIIKHREKIEGKVATFISAYSLYGKTIEHKIDNRTFYIHIYYDGYLSNNQQNPLLNSYKDYEYDLQIFDESYQLTNQELINKELQSTGFFVLATSKKMEAVEALTRYRKVQSTKSLFEHFNDKIDSKQPYLNITLFVIYLATIVRSAIIQDIKTIDLSMNDIMNEMNKIEIIRNDKNTYVRRHALTNMQKDILKCFKLKEKDLNAFIKEVNNRLSTK